MEIQLILSILCVWHLKIGLKSKKMVTKYNKGLLKKWCKLKLSPYDLRPLAHYPTVPKKSPKRAKSNYSFHWKLKGDRALILTYSDSQTETLCTSPVFLKIRVFQNASNSICTTRRTTGVRLLAQSDVVYWRFCPKTHQNGHN